MFSDFDFTPYTPEGINPTMFGKALMAQIQAESGGNFDSAVVDMGNKKTNAGIGQWQAQLLKQLTNNLVEKYPDIATTYPAFAKPNEMGDVWSQDALDQWKALSQDKRVQQMQKEYAAAGMKRNVERAREMGVKNPITSLLAADILHQYVPRSAKQIIKNAVTAYGDPSYYDLLSELQKFHGGKDPYPGRRKQFDKYLVEYYKQYGGNPASGNPLISKENIERMKTEVPSNVINADIPAMGALPTPTYTTDNNELLDQLYKVVNTRRANTATDQINQMKQNFVPDQQTGFMQKKSGPNPLMALILRLLLHAL